jgi:hypothetical protein
MVDSSAYKYEDGWRMVSKHAFGMTLTNIKTNDVVILSKDKIHYIIL